MLLDSSSILPAVFMLFGCIFVFFGTLLTGSGLITVYKMPVRWQLLLDLGRGFGSGSFRFVPNPGR